MSVVISAPYPGTKVTMVLPSPRFDDSVESESRVDVIRSMVGDTYTHVKSNDRYTLRWEFLLSRMKALELREFVRVYRTAEWLIKDHKNEEWLGSLVNSPFASKGEGRAGGWPGDEAVTVSLQISAKRK